MISVSTAWNALKHASGEELIRELTELGFGSFELSVKLSEAKLREIESILLQIEIASLHNFCPVPHGPAENGGGDFYFLSSPDPKERKLAVEASKKTIDWARRFGARAVVFHFGRVEMESQTGRRQLMDQIMKVRAAGHNDEADRLMSEELAVREEIKAPYLEAALQSARELVEAAKGEVQIGVENRYYYGEIPSIDEIALFMDEIPAQSGGYWHDFGHAWTSDFVGWAKHEDYLTRYGDRIIGLHIHDINGFKDHSSLTSGTIDFENLVPMIPKDVISVLEIHHATPEELVKSREIWKSLLSRNLAG